QLRGGIEIRTLKKRAGETGSRWLLRITCQRCFIEVGTDQNSVSEVHTLDGCATEIDSEEKRVREFGPIQRCVVRACTRLGESRNDSARRCSTRIRSEKTGVCEIGSAELR